MGLEIVNQRKNNRQNNTKLKVLHNPSAQIIHTLQVEYLNVERLYDVLKKSNNG